MKRREFLILLGVGATAWPLAARAQRVERVRRIGVFMGGLMDDPIAQADGAALLGALQDLGWIEGRNIRLDWRWYTTNVQRTRKDAEELVALAPDVILTTSGPTLTALMQASRTIPIVFTGVLDPVGAGYIRSLAKPGGNITGFALADFSSAAKWLELLKEIAPGIKRALVLRTFAIGGSAQFGVIQGVAPAMGVAVQPVDPSDPGEVERAISAFAREPNGGLIISGSLPALVNRELIIALAARLRLAAVYSARSFAVSGGLISYGLVRGDVVRRATEYVDRILRGEKPGDLPVQAPTKYELVLNMKTAKALGIEVPTAILLRADEVIE